MMRAFSGHSVANMGNAASYAMQECADFMEKQSNVEVVMLSTAIHVEPAEENYNYWYVVTVFFSVLRPIGGRN